MKIYIVTINQVKDSVPVYHKPEAFATLKEAKECLKEYWQKARKIYSSRKEFVHEKNDSSFSVSLIAEPTGGRYEGTITETEVSVPVYNLVTTSLNDGIIQSCDALTYTDIKKARERMKEFAKAEAKDAKKSGYEKVECYVGDRYATVDYPSGEDMQKYRFRILEDTL